MTAYKPAGYPDLSPYMIVEDAEQAMRFIETVLGGERLRLIPDADGRFHHAEIRIGDAVLMMADAGDGWDTTPSHVHLYVADVDATFAKALENGATAIRPPVKKDDADKRGGFKTPGGITFWVSTQVDAG